MKDIETRADIDALLVKFYEKVFADKRIGFIFTETARLDLAHHLPIIGDFWESLLFGTKNYADRGRNPLQIHADLNQKTQLETKHFRRWLEIFHATVDENFSGVRADFAKMRAEAIGNRILNFINRVEDGRVKIRR
jgi:hemoglobin